MADLAQQIGQFLAKRKAVVSQILAQGGEREQALLKQYGAPSTLDAVVAGAQQGFAHGFADDIERMNDPDGVAKAQIRAQAAHPGAYTAATLAGTMLTAGALRGAGGVIGRQRAAGARAGSRASGAAGGSAWASKNAERARQIEEKWSQFPLPGVKPQHRGLVMDAGHGAAWGYGGADVQESEGAADPRRFWRAIAGGAGAAVAAPLSASATVAASNIPLAFGKRRAFSKRMLEPPGVTRENPAGRPRDAIEIARSMDESAARGATGSGIIRRDTVPPLRSEQPHIQKLADQSLAPVAGSRIAELRGQQRESAASALEAAEVNKSGVGLRQQPDKVGEYVNAMMEAFHRRDIQALQSWISTLRGANRRNPEIMPRVRASVARSLATQERAQPGLNDTPEVTAFLRALGMGPSAKGGRPGALATARAGGAERFPTQRYEDALARTAEETPMRPRHAERLREEMEGFEPGPYTAPADRRRGPPVTARGDDQPYFLNPTDFFKEGRVNNAEVNMAGFMSGPIAYGLERGAVGPADRFMFGSPEDEPIEGVFSEVQAPPQAQPEQGLLADLRPAAPARQAPMQQAPAAAPPAAVPAPQQAAPAPPPSGNAVRDIQRLLLSAGFDVGPEGDDGIIGGNTQAAIEAFARISNMPGEITPERVLARLQAYPRERLAEDLTAAIGQ
jgi:hypothetical protein